MPSTMKSKQKKIVLKFSVILCWLFLWQICYCLVRQDVLIVSPWQVWKALWKNAVELSFWKIIIFSLLRIMKGYCFGIGVGMILGICAAKQRLIYELLYPIMSMVRATPVASFILLTLVWLQTDTIPSFISFLMVMPIIFTNIIEGMKTIDTNLLELAKVYQWSSWKKIRFIYNPGLWPYVAAASTMSLGLAWKAGIATEVIASPAFSIGQKLRDGKVYLETAELFAWTAVVILLSVLLEKGLCFLLHKIPSTPGRQKR